MSNVSGLQIIKRESLSKGLFQPFFQRRDKLKGVITTLEDNFISQEVIPFFTGPIILDTTRNRKETSSLFHLSISSGSFGYIDQEVRFSFKLQQAEVKKPPKLPEGFVSKSHGNSIDLLWVGPKPLPPRPRLDGGASLTFVPDEVVKKGGVGAIQTFENKPPENYVQQGQLRRTLLDTEALYLLGYPRSLSVRSKRLPAKQAASEALTTVLGFPNVHAMAILLWFAILCSQIGGASPHSLSSRLAYSGDESLLRNNVRGTCWDPTVRSSYPGIYTPSSFVGELASHFDEERYSQIRWHIPISEPHLIDLQTFWVHTQLKGLVPHSQGPDWCSLRRKAASMAALGRQRASGESNRGLDRMFEEGLGPIQHMARAFKQPSPLALNFELDEDLTFAVKAAQVWGPYLDAWRRQQMVSLTHLHKVLVPLNTQLVNLMDPYVAQVSKDRFPAGIAAICTLLRWPDRMLPRCFMEGFPVIGEVAESGVYKRLPEKPLTFDINKDFFGAPAIKFVNDLEKGSKKQSPKLLPLVEKELAKGRFYHVMSREDADTYFGRGKWRPMPLFLVEQALKDRLISDAKRGGHNEAVHETETIFVPSVDFIPEVLKALGDHIRSSTWHQASTGSLAPVDTAWLPSWAQPLLGTEDLDEAYGQCPSRPDQRGACVVAWHDPKLGWRYAEAKGLVFGLCAAVVGFNRWPLLITAAFRRVLAGLGTNYFDDFCVLSMLCDSISARDGLSKVAQLCGGSFGDGKSIPPGPTRAFIGVLADLSESATEGTALFQPREECLRAIRDTAKEMLKNDMCTPAEASKLRGKAGWASTHLFARIGRTGLSALKDRQYSSLSDSSITQNLREALHVLLLLHRIPPRVVSLRRHTTPPLIIYSDASWPSRMDGTKEITVPRIGWVIFDPCTSNKPQAFTMVAGKSLLSHLITREQQILAVEAFAAAAAPWILPEQFRDRDSIWFVDNAAAVSTLIRGAAKPEDIDNIAAAVTFQNAHLNHGVWFEWIDSDSNPADGLSRLGIQDPWTLEQGWDIHEVSHVDWCPFFNTYSVASVASMGTEPEEADNISFFI